MARSRRSFFGHLASIGTGLFLGKTSLASVVQEPAGGGAVPIETPDVPKLPFRLVDGVKEFHLVAEPVRTEFLAGKTVDAWGYNGSVPGPTMEVNQGDKVRVVFHNNLPEMTTVHFHGLEVPMAMDGVPGLGQDPVMPGGMFTYEFTIHQHGTFFYHSHFAMQEMMGMIGFFIVYPKEPYLPRVDRDFGIILQEWALLPNNTVPNTLSMEFNWLTLNGRAGPATTPMLVKQGERVRLRFVNLGMDHHPMHLHGNTFYVTATEGGRVPEAAWTPGNTVLVGVAQAREVEFEAEYIGDWMLHCHLPHHMMNQMVSMVAPMTQSGTGMPTGLGMEEGMGIVRKGNALAEELGPSLGRGLGMAADQERPTSTVVGQDHSQHHMAAPAEAYKVPGFPQDMWMVMDEMFANKPECHGLRPTWTAAMMGMMTLVRVLPPDVYDKIMELKRGTGDGGELASGPSQSLQVASRPDANSPPSPIRAGQWRQR